MDSALERLKGTDIYKSLSDADKAITIDLIERGAFSEEHLYQNLFEFQQPSIREFISMEWIGSMSKFLYPKWRHVLVDDIFAPGSVVNEVVWTGSTGTGKTSTAIIAELYNIVRLLSLRDPQAAMGVPSSSILALILISITASKAEMALMKKVIAILRESARFKEVKSTLEFGKYRLSEIIPYTFTEKEEENIIELPKNIIIYTGSKEHHALSMDLIGVIFDESEFRIGASEQALEFYLQTRERVYNRFLDCRYVLLCMVTSAKTTRGVVKEYSKTIKSGNPYIRLYSFAVWDIKEFDSYSKGSFYIMAGNRRSPSKILTEQETSLYLGGMKIPEGCKLIKVPEVYRSHFESNISRALRNMAGYMTSDDETLFMDLECLENYDHSLLPERIVVSSLGSRLKVIDYFKELFIKNPGGGSALKRFPNAWRYVHIDLAETTEAGLSMVHKELGGQGVTIFIVDFLCKVISPTRIDLESIADLFIDLQAAGVKFHTITADKFQSSPLLQKLEKLNVAQVVKLLSVDKTIDPYLKFAEVAANGLIRAGNMNETLLPQLRALYLGQDNKIYTTSRKDEGDTLCGSIYNALTNISDSPIYVYKPPAPTQIADVLQSSVLKDRNIKISGLSEL
jgi:hypothetical protein